MLGQKRINTYKKTSKKFPHTPSPLEPLTKILLKKPATIRSKLQTALIQKMKMIKMPLKTVKMTSWMSRTRTMMKRLLIVRKTSWKTVKRRQKCWQQNA